MRFSLIAAALAVPALARPAVDSPSVSNLTETQRAQAVVDAFNFAFNNYWKYCKGHDQIQPVDNTCADPRNGWGASAVDALSTAIVMKQASIVDEILTYIATIDFTKTDTEVSLFETTIRYLGGMLSAYDLLNGPFKGLVTDQNLDILLSQSQSLADTLSFAFDTPTGIPYNGLNITAQKPTADNDGTNGLATVGSLVLEWQRLSDLTGNPKYSDLTQKAESYILNPKPKKFEPWDGLLGTNMNITTGEFIDAEGGWIGGDDSAYEYMLKMYVYNSNKYGHYADRWKAAAKSSMQHLASHPKSRPDLLFLAQYNFTQLLLTSEHLACFDGGNFILGGMVFKDDSLKKFGLDLVAGCHDTYTSTETKIGPEIFGWDSTKVPANQTQFYQKNGFYIIDSSYDLRPEVLESIYYAYRLTGDRKYQNWAWDAFKAINATTRVGSGYSQITDVNAVGGGQTENNEESFLFAETMKYAYIIHSEDSPFQVDYNGHQEYVFNTECHPLKVVGKYV